MARETNNNIYVSLDELKSKIGRSDTSEDATILTLARRSSRVVDKYCSRSFYVTTTTKKFRTKGGSYYLFLPDLISISTITVDSVSLASANYELEPLNEYPKTSIRLLNNAFSSRQLVEVTGKWGWEEIYDDSGDTTQDDPLTSVAIELNVTDGDNFSIGQMLLLEDEQVYISNILTNKLTIKRAQNGTSAVEHATSTSIYIMRAPDAIAQACLMQTIRFYRGRDAAFSGTSGGEATLQFKEPALEIRVLLNPYKKY